jgi:hypothetical protein
VGAVENNIQMGNLGFPNECYDHRFDRRSFRTFGRKAKPWQEPSVHYSVLSGGVHIGFPNSLPPPPPPPIFAQIGKQKQVRKSKPKAPLPPAPKVAATSVAKRSPVRKAPPPPTHSTIIKRGSTVQVAAAKNSDGFLSQELSARNNESQLI